MRERENGSHSERKMLRGILAFAQYEKTEFVSEPMIVHIANIVTGCRMLEIVWLFFPAFSVEFILSISFAALMI